MNLRFKLGIWILILLILSMNVYAIGVTPGRTTLDFKPGLSTKVEFNVLNTEHKDMEVALSVRGELKDYVILKEDTAEFKFNEDSKTFSYEVTLPNIIEKPGIHEAEIVVVEVPNIKSKEGLSVGAIAGVATQLRVKVPYEGKYAETKLDVSSGNINENVVFIIPVSNLGKQKIKKAKASIEILNKNSERVGVIETNEESIDVGRIKELIGNWKANVEAGTYKAVCVVNYDDKIAKAETEFNIGSSYIDVLDVNVKDFVLGGVAKIGILVESKWNADIKDFFIDVEISNEEGDVISKFSSTRLDLKANTRERIYAYWDTDGLDAGNYNAKFILNYNGKKSEKQVKALVTGGNIDFTILGTARVVGGETLGGSLKDNSLLILVIFILVIVNIWIILYFRKRLRAKKDINE